MPPPPPPPPLSLNPSEESSGYDTKLHIIPEAENEDEEAENENEEDENENEDEEDDSIGMFARYTGTYNFELQPDSDDSD